MLDILSLNTLINEEIKHDLVEILFREEWVMFLETMLYQFS